MQLLHFYLNSLLKCVLQPKTAKKIHKALFLRSRSSKVIEFGANREPVYDFLLVINSNLGPISHRYWDTATYLLKIAIFFFPFHLEPSFGMTLFEFIEKALRFLKLESSKQPRWKFGNPSLHRFWLIHPCNGETDRQTELLWLRRAESSSCFRA